MIRKFFSTFLAVVFVAVSSQSVVAQGFAPGHVDIGPTIGLGGIGDASLAFGARFEKALNPISSLGSGTPGIMIGAEYYSWSSGPYTVSYIPVGATFNYHFKLADTKIDPFVGLGLGFQIVSCSYDGPFGFDCSGYSSGIYFIGRAGGRYFLSDKMALYADIGAGAATLSVGLMFKLK